MALPRELLVEIPRLKRTPGGQVSPGRIYIAPKNAQAVRVTHSHLVLSLVVTANHYHHDVCHAQ